MGDIVSKTDVICYLSACIIEDRGVKMTYFSSNFVLFLSKIIETTIGDVLMLH